MTGKRAAAIISAFTGFLASESFSDLHEYIEEVMGRPVMTHEMASKTFATELRERSKDDFLEVVHWLPTVAS